MLSEPTASLLQPSLFYPLCGCGRELVEIAGLCRHCYFSRQYSRRYFGGNREQVLARDGYCCQGCGGQRLLVVHHRNDGHAQQDLITLCAGCHPRIHHLRSVRYWLPELLAQLWSELHPASPLQLQLPLESREVA
jgi:hypothetical protein